MLEPIAPRSSYLKSFQRRLKRNPTSAEEHVEELLRSCRFKFKKQQCFYDEDTKTCHIADFWVPSLNVVIECDGWQHYTKDGLREDKKRDAAFRAAGIRTVRLRNREALALDWRKLRAIL